MRNRDGRAVGIEQRTRTLDKFRPLGRSAVLALAFLAFASAIAAEDSPLVLLIQRLPREEMPNRSMQPLADYIGALTGRRCSIVMPPNFPAYWEAVRRNGYDLAFDAPHFTDYRVQKFGFTVLVKTPETASYSLLVREDAAARDPAWLVGRRIASLGLLSIGTLRLNALFPNPMRQPVMVDVHSTEEAAELLLAGNVEAAFLPTSLVGRRVGQTGIAVALTTEPIPRLALSASPRLAPPLTDKIHDGLLRAHTTEGGRKMLHAIGLDYLDAATPEDFANQSYVLRGYWGY